MDALCFVASHCVLWKKNEVKAMDDAWRARMHRVKAIVNDTYIKPADARRSSKTILDSIPFSKCQELTFSHLTSSNYSLLDPLYFGSDLSTKISTVSEKRMSQESHTCYRTSRKQILNTSSR